MFPMNSQQPLPLNSRLTKRTIGIKSNPQQTYTFASILLQFRESLGYLLEKAEFEFILASAIETVHGEIASKPDILALESIDQKHYRAIIRFKTIHYTRIVTSLLLFGRWKEADCKFELIKLAQTPCFLSF